MNWLIMNHKKLLLRYRQSTIFYHAEISQFSTKAKIAQNSQKTPEFFSDTEKNCTLFHVGSAVSRFSRIYVDLGVIIYCPWVGEPDISSEQERYNNALMNT